MTASQAFKAFTNSVLADIAKIIAQEIRSQILGSILRPLAGMAWGGITSGFSSMFGSAAANTAGTVGGINMNNTSLANMKLANGGVVAGAGISAHSGTIVSSPTVFPFAKGVGLMGEAGPEAILPLKRNAQGKLGVVTENAGQSKGNLYNITVNVQSKQGENPEQFGQRAAEAMMRSVAKEEISNARRPGNTLNKSRFG
jgi:lambda family phage tail tape measure protein